MRETKLGITIVIGVALLAVFARFCLFYRDDTTPSLPPVTIEAPSDPIVAQSVYTISKTCLGIFYTNTMSITIGVDPYPLTMTCQLRPGGVLPPVAQQVFVWSVPCAVTYTTGPVVPPLCLTWELTKALPLGKIEEYCRTEVDGYFGWFPGRDHDGNNFYKVNEWLNGYRTYLPAIIKRTN